MRTFNRSFLLSIIIFPLVLSTCSSQGSQSFEKQNIIIRTGAGEVFLRVEIARTTAQHQQGLMYRKELRDGEGMLFIFERDQILSFWMKNTLIPLSIAYIAGNGNILEIFDMEPGNLDPVQSSRSARYALEVPKGWFGRAGIGPGDSLVIPE